MLYLKEIHTLKQGLGFLETMRIIAKVVTPELGLVLGEILLTPSRVEMQPRGTLGGEIMENISQQWVTS